MPAVPTEIAEGVRIALSALWERKARALLTTLGIVIGIVSVTSMFTVINGIEREFDKSMAMIGDNALFIEKTPWFAFSDWWTYRNRPPITDDLAPFLAERAETIVGATALAGAGTRATRGSDELGGMFVEASTTDYVEVGGADVEAGRFFSDEEARGARAVAVIGVDLVGALFPAEDPVGKELRLGGEVYEVVGVLAARGKFLGMQSTDNRAIVPLSTFRRHFSNDPGVSIKVRVRDGVDQVEAIDEITGLTRQWRGLDALEDNDFAVNRQDQFRDLVQGFKVAVYAVGLFLTALSLLVGGIGVMNIMFVSVKERTREIGVRKALGATRRAILFQFLVEAVMICFVGGGIGVGFAALAAVGLNQVFTAELSLGTVALAFALCGVLGVTFGLLPAWQAARARPIEALRYE